MNSLICDYNQRTSKPGLYIIIQKNCYDSCSLLVVNALAFTHLGSIVCDNKSIFCSLYISPHRLNWPHKIKSTFHKWFLWKTCNQLCKSLSSQSSCSLTFITRFAIIMHVPVHMSYSSACLVSNIEFFQNY